MPGQVAILQKQLSEIRDQLTSAQKQKNELTPAAADSPEVQNAIERALKEAAQREEVRVRNEALANAIEALEREQAETENELNAARAEQMKDKAKSDTLKAIKAVEGLQNEFDDAVLGLKKVCEKLEALEEKFGPSVRNHLSDIKREERPDYEPYFQYATAKLVALPEIALPRLERVNGSGEGAEIRWYGDLFRVSYGEFYQVD